jgi:hypothetical protein
MSVTASKAKRRGVAGAADQVLSSLSNGLILYAIAVVSSAQYFGRISLLLTLLAAAVGCMRGALGTPLLLKAAHATDEIRREGSYAVTAALLLSPVLVVGMWLLEGREVGTPIILVAIATPLVLVQDVLRYVVIAEGRPQVAAIWDGMWFLGSLALLVSTWMDSRFVDVNVLIGGWAALAFVALLGLAISLRIVPSFRGFFRWLAADWQHRLRYGIDAGLEQGIVFVILALVAALVSPVATAALRGATALLAPISMLTSAIPLVLIPESTRRGSTPQQVWKGLVRVSMVASSACLFAGIVIRLLPESIGGLVLGNSFGLAQQIVLISALEYAVGWWALAVMVWLKTFNRSADLLAVKIGYAIVMLAFSVSAALIFKSATGVAVAMALSSALVATVSLAWFTPWRQQEPADRPADESGAVTAKLPTARPHLPVWHHKVISKSRFTSRPLPDYVQLASHGRSGVSSPLIAMWMFIVMGVIGPLAIVAATGPAPNLSWLGPMTVAIIAAARFSWIIGLGERRVFELMFWTFTYAFMGLAPVTEIRERAWPPIVPRSDFALVWAGTFIVLIGTGAFLLGVVTNRFVELRKQGAVRRVAEELPYTFTVRHNRIVVLAIFAIAFNMYYSWKVGWIQFTQPRLDLNARSEAAWPSVAKSVFVRAGTYMTLLVCWVAAVRYRREAKRLSRIGELQPRGTMRVNLLIIWVVGILLANSMNPISNPRYLSGTAILAAGAALGIFATVARFRISAVGFVAALLVIFPVMDAFRYGIPTDFGDANPIVAFTSPDYDSFANITNGYLIVERDGIRVFGQFLGVLLFWIPRVLWPEKPVDTGIYIAQNRGYPVTNLSAPFWIEMYMNGGFVILVLAMFAAGYFLHGWDTRIDRQLSVFHMPGVLGSIVPFYMFILLRGSLLQAMPFLVMTVVCYLFVRASNKSDPRKGTKVARGPTRTPRVQPRERRLADV